MAAKAPKRRTSAAGRETRKQRPVASHGGRRAGAGRHAIEDAPVSIDSWTSKGGIPWASVRQAAEVGATHHEIVRALEIPEAALTDAANLARFRVELARGEAAFKLQLRSSIVSRGRRSPRNAGSVNALALLARNHLDFDKQLAVQESEPDLTTARPRLRDLLVRLAGQRSDIEGKRITPLELIRRETEAVEGATVGA